MEDLRVLKATEIIIANLNDDNTIKSMAKTIVEIFDMLEKAKATQ